MAAEFPGASFYFELTGDKKFSPRRACIVVKPGGTDIAMWSIQPIPAAGDPNYKNFANDNYGFFGSANLGFNQFTLYQNLSVMNSPFPQRGDRYGMISFKPGDIQAHDKTGEMTGKLGKLKVEYLGFGPMLEVSSRSQTVAGAMQKLPLNLARSVRTA